MDWDIFDFGIFAALVAGVGSLFWLAARRTADRAYRGAVGVALAAAFLLVWVNGAVGIIGNENNDANLMFVAMLVLALAGAILVRFEARGMARIMVAAALAQLLVAAIALIGDLGAAAPAWPRDILALTGFFTLLWLVSAWLFRRAAYK